MSNEVKNSAGSDDACIGEGFVVLWGGEGVGMPDSKIHKRLFGRGRLESFMLRGRQHGARAGWVY